QIIWNLLKNAIKFTPEAGEIAISSSNPSPKVLTISVRDTGVGMESEVMQRIFDPFEQGNRSFERRFGGLGLGLAISKSLAQSFRSSDQRYCAARRKRHRVNDTVAGHFQNARYCHQRLRQQRGHRKKSGGRVLRAFDQTGEARKT